MIALPRRLRPLSGPEAGAAAMQQVLASVGVGGQPPGSGTMGEEVAQRSGGARARGGQMMPHAQMQGAGGGGGEMPMPQAPPPMPSPPPQIGAGSGFDMAMMSPVPDPRRLTQPLPSMPPMGSPERPQPQLRLEDILQMPQPDIMPLQEPAPWQTTGPHPGMAGLAGPGRMNPMSMPAGYSPNYSPGSDPQFAQAPMQPFRMGGSGIDRAFQERGMQRPMLPPIQPAPSTMGGIDMGSLSPRDLMPSMSGGGAFMPASEPNPESMTMDFGGETRFLDRRRPALSPEQSAMEDEENAFRSLERTAPPEVVFEAASKRGANAAKAAGGGADGLTYEQRMALKTAEPPGVGIRANTNADLAQQRIDQAAEKARIQSEVAQGKLTREDIGLRMQNTSEQEKAAKWVVENSDDELEVNRANSELSRLKGKRRMYEDVLDEMPALTTKPAKPGGKPTSKGKPAPTAKPAAPTAPPGEPADEDFARAEAEVLAENPDLAADKDALMDAVLDRLGIGMEMQ